MLKLLVAKVTANQGERLKLEVDDGYGKYSIEGAFIVAPAGQAKAQIWAAPSTGDQVLCIIDDARPDLVYCLGAIWPDGKAPSITAPDQIYLQAPGGVTLADSTEAQYLTRDDHTQDELSKLKNALDTLANQISTHTHAVASVMAGTASVTSAASGVGSNSYSVAPTACDLVKGV